MPVVVATLFPETVQVSEEGLVNGLKDSDGIADTTDSATVTGTMTFENSPDFSLSFDSANSGLTTNSGSAVTWVQVDAENVVGRATEHGQQVDVIKASINDNGSYSVELLQLVKHPIANVEDVVNTSLKVTATDSSGVTKDAALSIGIQDDSPNAENITQALNYSSNGGATQNTNVMFVVDVTWSMLTEQLVLTKKAIVELLEQYKTMGDVKVTLVTFGREAVNHFSNWTDADTAIVEVQTLSNRTSYSGSTNYYAALTGAQVVWESATDELTGSDVKNELFFISDGAPTGLSGNNDRLWTFLSATTRGYWKPFLEANDINSHAYGVGVSGTEQSLTTSALDGVAYDGATGTDTVATFIQPDALSDHLSVEMVGTAEETLLLGELVGFGADGGYTSTISYDNIDYSFDGTSSGSMSSGTWNDATHILSFTGVDSNNQSYSNSITLNGLSAGETLDSVLTKYVEFIG